MAMPSWRLDLEEDEVRERRSEFLASVQSHDPHDLLGVSALYSLVGALSGSGGRDTYLETAELEVLQSVVLGGGVAPRAPISREALSAFWRELMCQCHVAAHESDFEDRPGLAAMAQSHSSYYRNPYGGEFFDRMVQAITAEYDLRYDRTGRFAASGHALVVLRQEIWGRFQDHMRRWGRIKNAGREALLETLGELSADFSAEQLEQIEALPRERLHAFLFNLIEDRAVRSLFVLDEAWIEARVRDGLPMQEVLEALSQPLFDHTPDLRGLIAANPVWNRPAIKLGTGYALYNLISLMSFPFHLLLSLLGDSGESKTRLEKVRGWFVEQEAQRILADAFPNATIISGGHWHRGSNRLETDLLLLADNHLLVFEAKGALIPPRVRTGHPGATAQFLRNVWGKSTRQSAELATTLRAAREPMRISNSKGETLLLLDPTKLRSISRFSVSVEQVGTLMNAPKILRELKIIDEDIDPAPSIILSELDQVLNHLPDEIFRLHYLTRRGRVCERHQIYGDELDLFTVYLQFGFAHLPPPDHELMILGASYSLHEYQDAQGKVSLPTDSALRNSPFFDRVLAQMRERGSPALSDVALLLLDMPLANQLEVEKGMRRAFRKSPRGDDWPVIMVPVQTPVTGFAMCLMLMDLRADQLVRRHTAFSLMKDAGERFGVKEAFAIVRLWKDENAYDAIYYGGPTLVSPPKAGPPG